MNIRENIEYLNRVLGSEVGDTVFQPKNNKYKF